MRLLVTGSRDWRDVTRLARLLDLFYAPDLVVVHGHCLTGADRLADRWAIVHGLVPERHPARWGEGRGAGFARNQEMVDLGADLCLAFIRRCRKQNCRVQPAPHGSHGASDCAAKAERAGITVVYARDGW